MIHYPDRFHMTPEQSLFLAKKKWDENVYCGMRMENRNITFPQTKTILQGVNVPSVQLDDIQAVLNMRDAWRFLLATMLRDGWHFGNRLYTPCPGGGTGKGRA